MNDDRYRWQDHVPSTVSWAAYLVFGLVIAAGLAFAGVERAETADALRQDVAMSIKASRMAPPAAAAEVSGMFVRHDVALFAPTPASKPCVIAPAILKTMNDRPRA